MQERDNATQDIADLHRKEQSAEDSSKEQELPDVSVPGKIVMGSNDDPRESEAALLSAEVAAGKKVKVEQSQSTQDSPKHFLPAGFRNVLENSGSGQSLDEPVRQEMESGMGTDLGDVKIHTDGNAGKLNQMIGSGAFALGKDVYFGEQNYNPGSSEGKHLLAHELVHTQQPGENVVRRNNDEDLKKLRDHDAGPNGNAFEKEKAGKQKDVDNFIKSKGGELPVKKQTDEFIRQNDISYEERFIVRIEEQIMGVRYQYIRELRASGVTEGDVQDPFATISGVDDSEYEKQLKELYEEYNKHIATYTDLNQKIRTDRDELLKGNDDKLKLISDYGLKITGVHGDRSAVTDIDAEAKKLLSWARAEVQSSHKKYQTLVRKKEKEERDLKKVDNKQVDPFETAQSILRNDLDGDKTAMSEADLQLVLKYFLKGSLSEDDKFVLVCFLSKQINNSNLEKVFGYSEEATSALVDPALLINALESYELLNYERRDYFARQENNKEYLSLETTRSMIVRSLKDMKAAKEQNDKLKSTGFIRTLEQPKLGLQESYKTKGFGRLSTTFWQNVAESKPKTYSIPALLGNFEDPFAAQLQKAITQYETSVPYPLSIAQLQQEAWVYYMHLGIPGSMLQSDFFTAYSDLGKIKGLLLTTSNTVYQKDSKYMTSSDQWGELGGQIFELALKTGADYLRIKESIDFFRKTNPDGFSAALTTLGSFAFVMTYIDAAVHDKASWGQVLTPFANLGLGHKFDLIKPHTAPSYGPDYLNKLTLDVNTNRDDKPPGSSMFNSMYNQNNSSPIFKGASNSVPSIFLNAGLSGSNTKVLDGKDKRKWTYDFKVTFHWVPGSEAVDESEQTTLGKIGMYMQNPFDPDKANNLLMHSPTNDMFNMWGSASGSYKPNSWFMTSGSVAGGTYNLGGPAGNKMSAIDYKFNVGIDKLKFGNFTLNAGTGISGSYAGSTSPTVDDKSSLKIQNTASLNWKSVTINFSHDFDFMDPNAINKIKGELEFAGKGRYSALKIKAMLMNMKDSGSGHVVLAGGLGVTADFGGGGFKSLKNIFKF